MKVRLKNVGMVNMFRLSKLGADCLNSEFMDKNGNIFELVSDKNKPRRVVPAPVISPLLYRRAQCHPDWVTDTR